AAATAARCRSTPGRTAVGISVGPSSVTCAGTARGSPASTRRRVSWAPHGSGMSTAMPIWTVSPDGGTPPLRSTLRAATSATDPPTCPAALFAAHRREEADPLVRGPQGRAGHRPGLLRAGGEQLVQLRRVVEGGARALLDG